MRRIFMMTAALATSWGLSAPAWALCEGPGDPDCVDFFEDFRGTVDFFATGASLTVNDDADDRPDRVLEEASVTIQPRRIPNRAQLVKAYIYFGGSLYADGDEIEVPDTEIELRVPGANDFAVVQGDKVYTSGAIPGFPEVILYSVRSDITEIMRSAGGQMDGTYTVRGFAADIFDGPLEHTAANASFSIVLVFEEARLPPRNIVLFDGLQEVLGSTISLSLSNFFVSPVPSGGLTLYAQEGDCNPGPDACDRGNNLSGLERARVLAPGGRELILSGPLNPQNDLFNRSINTVTPPIRDVPGTDIDFFDLSDLLEPGDDQITVEITTPNPANGQSGELVGLVYVVVGIDVFAPELRVDSRIDISTDRGTELESYFPGDPLRVEYSISNTGNLPGTVVSFETELPELVTDFVVLAEPEGTTVTVDREGGAAGRGKIRVDNLTVRHGEVNDLVLLVETNCPLPAGGDLVLSASVSAALEGSAPFVMSSSVALTPATECGPRFFLFGGAGCQTSGPVGGGAPWLALGLLVLFALHRRRQVILLLLALTTTGSGCAGDVDDGNAGVDRPAPVPIGFDCPDLPGMAVIPSIEGRNPYCMDRYEARIEGNPGNADQPPGGDGSTSGMAVSERFQMPSVNVTWHQARAACANAGKRLCTSDEWLTACRGVLDTTFPYGEAYESTTCNGFDSTRGGVVETGSMIRSEPRGDGFYDALGCVTPTGVYDLSGNVWEWNDSSYLQDTRRGLVGGSFRSNLTGLRCVSDDAHEFPTSASDGIGFRCCAELTGI